MEDVHFLSPGLCICSDASFLILCGPLSSINADGIMDVLIYRSAWCSSTRGNTCLEVGTCWFIAFEARNILIESDRIVILGASLEPEVAQFFRTAYRGKAPWDIGRTQDAFIGLEREGKINGKVLDVGCGTGENALYLASNGHEVWGVDIVDLAIERAKAKNRERRLGVHFLVGDAFQLDALGTSFQTVIDCGFFHILSDEDRARYVTSLSSVLVPGGTFHMLCFSEKAQMTSGPRHVSEKEITDSFAGWKVRSIRGSHFDTNLDPGQVPALLASIESP
jgi:SAM-dependent methyltransferase